MPEQARVEQKRCYHGWIFCEKTPGMKDYFSVQSRVEGQESIVRSMGYGEQGAAAAVAYFEEASVAIYDNGVVVNNLVGLNLGRVALELTPLGFRVCTGESQAEAAFRILTAAYEKALRQGEELIDLAKQQHARLDSMKHFTLADGTVLDLTDDARMKAVLGQWSKAQTSLEQLGCKSIAELVDRYEKELEALRAVTKQAPMWSKGDQPF